MRAVVQRVLRAHVDVVAADGGVERVGQIPAGLCVFVGATHGDDEDAAVKLADKVWHVRILDDPNGVMNESLAARAEAGEPPHVLIVSQFTLYGNTDKGRRPSWIDAARPEHAEPLVERVVARLRELGVTVATGRFRAEMHVELVNDGPVTLVIETTGGSRITETTGGSS